MSVFYTGWVLEGVPRELRCEAKSSRTKISKVTRDFRQVRAAMCVIPYVLFVVSCIDYLMIDVLEGSLSHLIYPDEQGYKRSPNRSRNLVQIRSIT